MRTTLTKSEIRQFFKEDPAFLWFKNQMQEIFNERHLLLNAKDTDNLFEIKGMSRVLNYIEEPERLLDYLDLE